MAGSLKPITRRQKKTILGSLLVVFALVLAGFLNALSYNITFAEMPAEEKNMISHRKKAIEKFLDFYKDYTIS